MLRMLKPENIADNKFMQKYNLLLVLFQQNKKKIIINKINFYRLSKNF